MLDIKQIRSEPDKVKEAVKNKKETANVDRILELDLRRKELTHLSEELRHQRKELSKNIGALMKSGDKTAAEKAKSDVAAIKDKMKTYEDELADIEKNLKLEMLLVPNLPLDDVPVGTSEEENVTVRESAPGACKIGQVKPHWEIGEALGILDLPAGAKIAGSGFPVFKGPGARLVRALMNFMLDVQTSEFGYRETWIPPVVNRDSMTGTGQLPKFEFDLYRIEADDLFLVPTAEVPLTNVHADDSLLHKDLPLRYAAYSPCFRREAGSHGKDTRGLIRVHWFDKIEMVAFCGPEQAEAEHEHMLLAAEAILKKLGLRYRVQLLCTGEMSFANEKCYDIELWCPGVRKWLEVSSVSRFGSFQARRMNARFRGEDGKLHHLHTLNGSGVAFPRLIVSILENFQNKAGGVDIHEALVPYMGGIKTIDPVE